MGEQLGGAASTRYTCLPALPSHLHQCLDLIFCQKSCLRADAANVECANITIGLPPHPLRPIFSLAPALPSHLHQRLDLLLYQRSCLRADAASVIFVVE